VIVSVSIWEVDCEESDPVNEELSSLWNIPIRMLIRFGMDQESALACQEPDLVSEWPGSVFHSTIFLFLQFLGSQCIAFAGKSLANRNNSWWIQWKYWRGGLCNDTRSKDNWTISWWHGNNKNFRLHQGIPDLPWRKSRIHGWMLNMVMQKQTLSETFWKTSKLLLFQNWYHWKGADYVTKTITLFCWVPGYIFGISETRVNYFFDCGITFQISVFRIRLSQLGSSDSNSNYGWLSQFTISDPPFVQNGLFLVGPWPCCPLMFDWLIDTFNCIRSLPFLNLSSSPLSAFSEMTSA